MSAEKTDQELIDTARLIDEFEGYPHPHCERIAAISDAIADRFDLADHDRHALGQAALLHDIGEMVMSRDYISSVSPLSERERLDMQRHPVIGEQETAKRGMSRAVQLIVRWHHEWWNGMGYPDGLEGRAIPLTARILRVADTYAAMTDSRPYSVAVPESEVKRYIAEWAGIEFDPSVVKVFMDLDEVDAIRSFADLEESKVA